MQEYDKRIIRLFEWLLFQKKIMTAKEFCQSIDLLDQPFSKIKKGTNHFTVIQIENVCKIYNVRNDKTIEINDF